MAFSKRRRAAALKKVLDGLSKGIPLAVICREEGMPCDDTVRAWADADQEIARAIARARELGFDAIAMDALAIIDEEPEHVITTIGEDRTERRIDSASVKRAKNRFEARLKLLAKWDPKRYGELIKHGNADGSNFDLASEVEAARRRVSGGA
ncbi:MULTISPECIES: hypothetical protein [unclassified Novosphingobium]|uniref:terminase small subunit-like protein n=1 Tax=unclassified Novosphingobium TaxID=2644732 RepID=UPI000D434AFA|nr:MULTISPECIES: hypothetical protein [unclassified Novosphingobium]PTR05674.1 hypothetical protein C8K11_1274 [Novosphingobium sp. GV055]PUA94242.1 hypothetical protein C8K12_1274 [Novosphingobium sp. GV061]PUB12345.1 hypothetical protein C8K14_1274 [Novosphingobium sp. GV079]PUB37259.1 hypothetical protein C8K10_1274 [Novosphingobium sp. GV027]